MNFTYTEMAHMTEYLNKVCEVFDNCSECRLDSICIEVSNQERDKEKQDEALFLYMVIDELEVEK